MSRRSRSSTQLSSLRQPPAAARFSNSARSAHARGVAHAAEGHGHVRRSGGGQAVAGIGQQHAEHRQGPARVRGVQAGRRERQRAPAAETYRGRGKSASCCPRAARPVAASPAISQSESFCPGCPETYEPCGGAAPRARQQSCPGRSSPGRGSASGRNCDSVSFACCSGECGYPDRVRGTSGTTWAGNSPAASLEAVAETVPDPAR